MYVFQASSCNSAAAHVQSAHVTTVARTPAPRTCAHVCLLVYSLSQEKETVLSQLNQKAKMTTKILNSIEGVKLNEVAGAMYAFPQIHLPDKVVQAAKV